MDSFDKKSLHLLAGIKTQLNECMNTPLAAMTAPKSPATLNITANSGDELSQMLKDIASMGAKDYAPTQYAGRSNDIAQLDQSQMVGVPAFANLLSKIDQYDEIKDDINGPPLGTEPDERIMSGRDFPLDGDQNNSVVAAGDELVHRGMTAESLMKEYRKYVNESDELSRLLDLVRTRAKEKGISLEKAEAEVRGELMNKKGINPPAMSHLNDDIDGNTINPQPKAGIEVVQKTGRGTYSAGAANFSVSPDGKKINVVASPKTSIAAGPQEKDKIAGGPQANVNIAGGPQEKDKIAGGPQAKVSLDKLGPKGKIAINPAAKTVTELPEQATTFESLLRRIDILNKSL